MLEVWSGLNHIHINRDVIVLPNQDYESRLSVLVFQIVLQAQDDIHRTALRAQELKCIGDCYLVR